MELIRDIAIAAAFFTIGYGVAHLDPALTEWKIINSVKAAQHR